MKPPQIHRLYPYKHLLASDYPYIKDMKNTSLIIYMGYFYFSYLIKFLTIPAIHASVLPLKRAN